MISLQPKLRPEERKQEKPMNKKDIIDEMGKKLETLKTNQNHDWKRTKNLLTNKNVENLLKIAGITINYEKKSEMMTIRVTRGTNEGTERILRTNSMGAVLNIVEGEMAITEDKLKKRALIYLNNFLVQKWNIKRGQVKKIIDTTGAEVRDVSSSGCAILNPS